LWEVEAPKFSRQSTHGGGKVVNSTHLPALLPIRYPWQSRSQGNYATGRIKSMKNPNYPIGSGPGSSVSIATDYGLDGPGSNPGGDEIFRPSRPALGPTQPPVKRVPVLSRG